MLIDLLNRFYVIKKNCRWIAYQKYTNRLKKKKQTKIWLILYDLSENAENIVSWLVTIATEIV